MTVEQEPAVYDVDECEVVEIQDLQVEDLLDFARYGEYEALKAISESEYASKLASFDSQNVSLLHMTSANGHFECTKLLLECPEVVDKCINIKNAEGNTPLHWAALNAHVNVVCLLLEKGADITLKNSIDRSAFDEAVAAEKFEVTSAIIAFLEKSQESKKLASSKDENEESEEANTVAEDMKKSMEITDEL